MARLTPLDESDPYYWLTSQLAARGAQRVTCRVIAAIIFGFGCIPVVLEFSSSEPQGIWRHVGAVLATLCCFAMGSQWLRPGWPSRALSRLCALAGTAFIAAFAVLAADPFVGLIGITSSAVLTFYVALFHSLRLLAVTWSIYAAALIVLIDELAVVDGALAVGGALIVSLTNVFAAFTCRALLKLIRTDLPNSHLEPVTGLLTREGFHEQIATLLGARSRQDDRYLVVVVAHIDNLSAITSLRSAAFSNDARVTIAQCVRETVRREALVAHPGIGEFLIADVFTDSDPTPLSLRLRLAIANAPAGMTASIGVVSTALGHLTPHSPYEVLEELLTIASTAMFEARAAGGNQTRHAINPALTLLSGDSAPDRDNSDFDTL